MTRLIRCSSVDEAAVVELGNGELTKGYKNAVTAAIPQGVEPSAQFWSELATIVTNYFMFAEQRATVHDTERMQKIVMLIDTLNKEVRATNRGSALSQWGQVSGRLLATLYPAKIFAETYIEGRKSISKAFSGKRDPHREHLYCSMFDLWVGHLGQKIEFSRTKTGGPLIRFMVACVTPLMIDPPTARGFSAAVERKRHPRKIAGSRKRPVPFRGTAK